MRIRGGMAALLAAGMLLSASGGAGEGWFPTWQSTPTPSPLQPDGTVFSFRGGVRWGMSPEEVRGAETGVQMEERSQAEWSVLYSVSRVEVSRFFADLVYIFQQQKLNMILYAFDPAEPAGSYAYLAGALSNVYGERLAGEGAEVVALMDRVYPGMYTVDTLSDVLTWQRGDGTRVFLYRQRGGSFSVLYASPDSWLTDNGVYITSGL